MASLDSFDPEFGYPMLVFVLSIFQLAWMAYNVGAARKKYDVKVNGYDFYKYLIRVYNIINKSSASCMQYSVCYFYYSVCYYWLLFVLKVGSNCLFAYSFLPLRYL